MGKRPDKQQPPSLDGMAIESFDDWMASYSEADELSIDALDLVPRSCRKPTWTRSGARSFGKTGNVCPLRSPLSAYTRTIRIFHSI